MTNVFAEFDIKKPSDFKAPVTITSSAIEYLTSVLVANEPESPDSDHVSLGVKGGGCSGLTYVWDFASRWPDVHWSNPIEGVLVLDPFAEMHIIGCEIDFVKELGGAFLKINNPNAVASCGCGESFNT
jgi:iron-sulfur cluster assembly protein